MRSIGDVGTFVCVSIANRLGNRELEKGNRCGEERQRQEQPPYCEA
jgi:hypothetical protein